MDGGDPSLAGLPPAGGRRYLDEADPSGAYYASLRHHEPEHAAFPDHGAPLAGYPGQPHWPAMPADQGHAGYPGGYGQAGADGYGYPPDQPGYPAGQPAAGDAHALRSVPDVPAPEARLSPDDQTVFIRPYIRTGGRTRGPANLGIETLVSVNPDGPRGALQPDDRDHQLVVGLCREPRSVAEVAALTSLPLGVARVLLADMARIGVIRVHRSATAPNGAPDLALMQRVLAGLRRL